MNFTGTGKRLAQGDVGSVARMVGMETAALLAVLEVEAAGRGFDTKNRPKMLRETHVFYRELGAGALRNAAVKAGLATAKWTRNYSADSYPDLQRMLKMNETAALRSCSWGLGQIMGFNHGAAGHRSALEMVQVAMQGERQQLQQLANLVNDWGLVAALKGKDLSKADSWRAFAKRYNGSGYATHNYHGKLAAAYRKHKSKDDMAVPTTPAHDPISKVLRRNMKGEAVRNLQSDLARLGYVFTLGIDGRYGPETERLVRAFQQANRLQADGIAGRDTLAAIAKALEAIETKVPIDATPVPDFDKKANEAKTIWDRIGEWIAGLIRKG